MIDRMPTIHFFVFVVVIAARPSKTKASECQLDGQCGWRPSGQQCAKQPRCCKNSLTGYKALCLRHTVAHNRHVLFRLLGEDIDVQIAARGAMATERNECEQCCLLTSPKKVARPNGLLFHRN
jgi:hypothetical protein